MARRIFTLLVVGILIPACKIDSVFLPQPGLVINAQLRGSQVVPAVPTAVTSTNATLTVPQGHQSMDFSVTYTGSGTITAVEIRLGVAGTNGPLLFTLATAPFTNPLTGTVTGLDLVSVPSQGIFFFEQALDRIIAGEAYILISTVAAPAGEMRAQLGASTLASGGSSVNSSMNDCIPMTWLRSFAPAARDASCRNSRMTRAVSKRRWNR